MATEQDYNFMARALRLARRGLYTTDPNPRVGCVVVRDGAVVGEAWHERAGQDHAEVLALNAAGDQARGATVYVTLEPCSHHGKTPPCTDALVTAGVARVVAALQDPNPLVKGSGLKRLRERGIQVETGVLAREAEALNPGFVKRMRSNRPYLRCKLAMSLDGRTAMASGESKWITGPDARRDVQHLRARSSAILTGIGTVLADDPDLSVRESDIGVDPPPGGWLQPLKVVVDPRLSTPADARLLSSPGRTLIATTCEEDDYRELLTAAGAEVMVFPGTADRVSLDAVLAYLAEVEMNEVLLETGATLSGSMLRAGLVDEMVFYMAPVLMGDQARGLFQLPDLDHMADRLELDILDVRAVGRDWRITARPRITPTPGGV